MTLFVDKFCMRLKTGGWKVVRATGAVALAVLLTASARPVPTWTSFVHDFVEADMASDPGFAIAAGRHDHDGELPDWSEAGLARRIAFLKSSLETAKSYDTGKLTGPQRFERDYLIAVIRSRLFWLTDADEPHRSPVYYFRNGIDPGIYASRPYADARTRMRAMIAYLRRIPEATTQIRSNLHLPLPASQIDFGVSAFGGLARYYESGGKAAFASVKDPDLQQQYDAAAKSAAGAMQGLSDWLGANRATATQAFALGPERFSRMLSETVLVDTPLDQLEATGRADLARNKKALEQVCADYLPKGSVGDCIARAAAEKAGDGALAEARRQVAALRAFVTHKQLLTLPGKEQVLVQSAPPYNARNLAFIDPPGTYDKGVPSIYYIASPDPSWPMEKQRAYIPATGVLLSITAHEVIPGHFAQLLHANRVKSLIGRLYLDYAFVEGWAHYSEEMILEAGYGNNKPAFRIGELTNALLRDVRLLAALGMHTKGMTVDEARNMFVTDAYQDAGSAEQQAARGTWDPGYLNYTLGKLMILKLRSDWMHTHKGSTALKDFHDRLLDLGGPPLPLVRKAMLREDGPAL